MMQISKPHRFKSWRILKAERPDLVAARIMALLIATAYAIRVLLMPLTSQNDLVLTAWQSHYINQGHWNIYAYMTRLYEERNFVTNHPPAAYPYGFYAFTAAWLEGLRLAGLIDYNGWTTQWAISGHALWFLLLKLPLLAVDLAIGVLLLKAARPGYGLLAWAGWAWSGSVAYMLLMGQNDLYPTLFTVLATVLGARALDARQSGRGCSFALSVASMAMLGIGATFKIIPLALAAPFALVLAPRWRDRLLLTAVPVLIFGASALPFVFTPAFVDGVLFNWEGVRVFSAAQIFATPTSLFIMAYVALLVVLVSRSYSVTRPPDLWLIGAAVFSSLFLFSWSQFYWAVWLTPFALGLIVVDAQRYRYWAALWLILEVAFCALLFSLHRDFSIGLLASMSSFFRFAQLDAVIALFTPGLARPVEILWTVMRTAEATAQLMILVGAMGALILPALPIGWRPPERNLQSSWQISLRNWAGVLLMPAIIAILGAVIVFTLSRSAVAHDFWYPVSGQITLTAAQPILKQTIPPPREDVTGLLLAASPSASASLPSAMRLCARPASSSIETSSPTCAPGRLIQTALFHGYGFIFAPPLPGRAHPYALEFQLMDAAPDTRATLTVVAPPDGEKELYSLQHGEWTQTGIARLVLLRAFNGASALSALQARLLEDRRLLILWGLSLAICLAIIGCVVTVSMPTSPEQALPGALPEP